MQPRHKKTEAVQPAELLHGHGVLVHEAFEDGQGRGDEGDVRLGLVAEEGQQYPDQAGVGHRCLGLLAEPHVH